MNFDIPSSPQSPSEREERFTLASDLAGLKDQERVTREALQGEGGIEEQLDALSGRSYDASRIPMDLERDRRSRLPAQGNEQAFDNLMQQRRTLEQRLVMIKNAIETLEHPEKQQVNL